MPHPIAPPDPARAAVWRRVRRLLVVRLDKLGDLLMTTPAIAALRAGLPQARITLLTSTAGAPLEPHLPEVDDVIAWDAPWVKHETAADPAADRQRLAQIVERRFDAAAIFTVCTQSALPAALFARLAGIPLRLAHCRENPYALLTDWAPETDADLATARHEVRRQLDLVARVGFTLEDERLRFALRPEDVRRVGTRLRAAGIDARAPLVVVHPGATAASRRYPADRFGTASALLAHETGAALVYTGSAAEAPFADAARARLPGGAPSFAGTLTLGELAALIARATVLVTNNSGPVHLAAALGTPVVDLYALTNPQHTPWQVPARVLNHDVPCRNCLKSVCPQGHHECLLGVPPEAVTQAALELMRVRRHADAPLLTEPTP